MNNKLLISVAKRLEECAPTAMQMIHVGPLFEIMAREILLRDEDFANGKAVLVCSGQRLAILSLDHSYQKLLEEMYLKE